MSINYNFKIDQVLKAFIPLLIIVIANFSCEKNKEGYFTSGFKTLELTDSSVILWTRLYHQEKPNPITHERRAETFRHPLDFDENMPIEEMDGGVTGTSGEVQITISHDSKTQKSSWIEASENNDYTVSMLFNNLTPNTKYEVTFESRFSGQQIQGFFKTPPANDESKSIHFTTSTCQYFWSYDDSLRGFKIYDIMREMNPDFFVQTGDYVYYDKPGPLAKDGITARHKWHAMDSWPALVDFHLQTPMYMIKDDHDLLKDDISDPLESYGQLTYSEGLKIWKENVPLSDNPYRTYRWGKDLQIWLVEGREYRSSNKIEDSPEKTILGIEQKKWLEQTIQQSDATFKILFSATPIVGPDREKKSDNHANKSFQTEGDWLRSILSQTENIYIINGDRHWQYHSIDSLTQVHEFGSGPVSNAHAQGWKKGDKRPQHQFLRVNGGFLGVKVSREGNIPQIIFTHYDVEGNAVNTRRFIAKE